ncbi:MAG: ATP synthase F0 subunit C [Deltaproteobacteria bacterium]|nr:ATP synthase F0 subunit C [Candidatus Zymogenaceae bacterium]
MGKKAIMTVLVLLLLVATAGLALAQEETGAATGALDPNYTIYFALSVLGAGLAIGLGACGTGVGMGAAVRGALEGAARNPDTYGRLLTTMMIGLAMIESLAIYALVIALILLYANPFAKLFGV